MMRITSKAEHKSHVRKLNRFCEDNFCIMYNFMVSVENDRYQHQGKCSSCEKKFWRELKRKGIIKKKKVGK